MFTKEEYIKLVESIHNSEVAEIISNVLSKVHSQLESNIDNMTKKELIQYDMFKLFFKQYNTTLVLSNKVNYVFQNQDSYIDLKSIYNIIRSLHELYLTYHYLFLGKHFSCVDLSDELDFKYLLYQYSGIKDSIKAFNYVKNSNLYSDNHKNRHEEDILKAENLLIEIRKHQIYLKLPQKVKDDIKQGNWKVNNHKKLSWSDMLLNTHILKNYGVMEYSILSQYAHTSYHSIMLERTHDYNLDGLLCHLYILASVFAASISDTLNLRLNDCTLLKKRELALVYDFMNLAKKQP